MIVFVAFTTLPSLRPTQSDQQEAPHVSESDLQVSTDYITAFMSHVRDSAAAPQSLLSF